jgi:hypothetical protein
VALRAFAVVVVVLSLTVLKHTVLVCCSFSVQQPGWFALTGANPIWHTMCQHEALKLFFLACVMLVTKAFKGWNETQCHNSWWWCACMSHSDLLMDRGFFGGPAVVACQLL